MINKEDRHKRRAYLEVEMFGRKIETRVVLEIVAKVTTQGKIKEKIQ